MDRCLLLDSLEGPCLGMIHYVNDPYWHDSHSHTGIIIPWNDPYWRDSWPVWWNGTVEWSILPWTFTYLRTGGVCHSRSAERLKYANTSNTWLTSPRPASEQRCFVTPDGGYVGVWRNGDMMVCRNDGGMVSRGWKWDGWDKEYPWK